MAIVSELRKHNLNAATVAANCEAYWRSVIAAGLIRAAHFGPTGNAYPRGANLRRDADGTASLY